MGNSLILLLFGIIPQSFVVEDHIEVAEINHFYDEQGRLVFDQIIFYEDNRRANRLDIVDWRLIKDENIIPIRNNNGFSAIWYDNGTFRKLNVREVRTSWTQYDPELVGREFLPKERRKLLASPRKPKTILEEKKAQ